MRAKTPEELFAANPPNTEPIIDGWFLPNDVYNIFKSGRQNDVRTITGSNGAETVPMGDYMVTEWATLQARTGKAIGTEYRFTQEPPPMQGAAPGAVHGAEVQYAFHNLDLMPRGWTETDRKVEDIISTYWVNFAKTGDPNGNGLPHWSSVQEQASDVLEIAEKPHMINRPNAEQIQAEEDKYYSKGNLKP